MKYLYLLSTVILVFESQVLWVLVKERKEKKRLFLDLLFCGIFKIVLAVVVFGLGLL